jgi:hypothetical protein
MSDMRPDWLEVGQGETPLIVSIPCARNDESRR